MTRAELAVRECGVEGISTDSSVLFCGRPGATRFKGSWTPPDVKSLAQAPAGIRWEMRGPLPAGDSETPETVAAVLGPVGVA